MALPWKKKVKEQKQTMRAMADAWQRDQDMWKRADAIQKQRIADQTRWQEQSAKEAREATFASIDLEMQNKMLKELIEEKAPGEWTRHYINVVDERVQKSRQERDEARREARHYSYKIQDLENQVARLTKRLLTKEPKP